MITPSAGHFNQVWRPAALRGRRRAISGMITPTTTCAERVWHPAALRGRAEVIRPLIGVVIMQLIAVVIMELIAVIMRRITPQYLDHRAPPFGEPADVAVGFELREVCRDLPGRAPDRPRECPHRRFDERASRGRAQLAAYQFDCGDRDIAVH